MRPPTHTRAAYCLGPGEIGLREIPLRGMKPDDAIVEVHSCGICGTDLHYYLGEAPPPPVCLGHEISGRLFTRCGALEAGTPVVVEPLVPCAACSHCRQGEPNLCPTLRLLGNSLDGGLADRVVVPSASVYSIPPNVDLDTAVLTEPLAVAVHAIGLARPAAREEVLVLGGGTIGLLVGFVAAMRGARVTVSARHQHQRSSALMLGATAVADADEQTILAATDENRPDVVFETVGGEADTMNLALTVVKPGGRIVGLGKFNHPIALDPLRFLMKEVRMVSSMTYSRKGPLPDFIAALALLADHLGLLRRLITHRVGLDRVAAAFALAADKSSGAIKIAVDVATSR